MTELAACRQPPALSVVVPVFNQEAVLPEFHRRLSATLDKVAPDAEVVYVNDGSSDARWRCSARCTLSTSGWR